MRKFYSTQIKMHIIIYLSILRILHSKALVRFPVEVIGHELGFVEAPASLDVDGSLRIITKYDVLPAKDPLHGRIAGLVWEEFDVFSCMGGNMLIGLC